MGKPQIWEEGDSAVGGGGDVRNRLPMGKTIFEKKKGKVRRGVGPTKARTK